MSIGEWKNNGFEIEVNRWDHEIFGKGGKGGLLNKKIIRMIRALLDERDHPKVQFDNSHIHSGTWGFRRFGRLLEISRTTIARQVQELEELAMVRSKEEFTTRQTQGRRHRIIQSTNIENFGGLLGENEPFMPIDNLTIKIDLKNLPKLLEWKEDDWDGFDLCRVV